MIMMTMIMMTMIMMTMGMIMMIAGDNSARLLSGRGGGREIWSKPKNKTKKCWNVQGVISLLWWDGGKLMNIGDKFWKFIIDSEMRKLGEKKKRTTFVMISSQGHLYGIYSGKLWWKWKIMQMAKKPWSGWVGGLKGHGEVHEKMSRIWNSKRANIYAREIGRKDYKTNVTEF